MPTQYGNLAQHDHLAGPYTFHYFILSANEHKIISL